MTRPNCTLPRVLAALQAAPASKGLTQGQLVALLGISNASTSRSVHALIDQGKAYVCRWERAKGGEGQAVAAYTAGSLEPAECNIDVFTQAEISKRYRERNRPPPARDFLTACFYGPGA